MSRSLPEAREALEVGDDGDASEVEGVLARAFVARLGPLNAIDAGERVFDRGPLPHVRAALGLVLRRAQGLQQGFLGMDRNGPPAACRGGTRRALEAGLADRRRKVDRGGADRDRDDLLGGT